MVLVFKTYVASHLTGYGRWVYIKGKDLFLSGGMRHNTKCLLILLFINEEKALSNSEAQKRVVAHLRKISNLVSH